MKVPVGTLVKRDGQIIADLTTHGQEEVVAKGGDGGFGNAHFKSSVRQTPRIHELGEMGDAFEAELELKLLADVGLVGLPNAGKSTLLSVVSNAKPEIADYAFTTLVPNLGVADIDDGSVLIADIPGLIEGASEGKGLGGAFLRHVERTAVLLHLVAGTSSDVASDYVTIRSELEKYSPELVTRPEIIALTKIDTLDDELIEMQSDELKRVAPDSKIYPISSIAHRGTTELLRELRKITEQTRQAEKEEDIDAVENEDMVVIRLPGEKLSESWSVEVVDDIYHVYGEKIEKFGRRTNYDNFDSLNRLRDIMKKMGITHELRRAGAEGESIIDIGGRQFTLVEQ